MCVRAREKEGGGGTFAEDPSPCKVNLVDAVLRLAAVFEGDHAFAPSTAAVARGHYPALLLPAGLVRMACTACACKHNPQSQTSRLQRGLLCLWLRLYFDTDDSCLMRWFLLTA